MSEKSLYVKVEPKGAWPDFRDDREQCDKIKLSIERHVDDVLNVLVEENDDQLIEKIDEMMGALTWIREFFGDKCTCDVKKPFHGVCMHCYITTTLDNCEHRGG